MFELLFLRIKPCFADFSQCFQIVHPDVIPLAFCEAVKEYRPITGAVSNQQPVSA